MLGTSPIHTTITMPEATTLTLLAYKSEVFLVLVLLAGVIEMLLGVNIPFQQEHACLITLDIFLLDLG